MAKPASSATLDTGHALYTNLAAAWPLLEGSGTVSADKKGSRTLTLSGTGLWSSDGDGPVILTTSNSDNHPLQLGSSLAFGTTQNFSIAWRAKQTTSNDYGMIFGDPSATNSYVYMRGGVALYVNLPASLLTFSGVTDFTALDDWVLTGELETGVTYHFHLYKNGVEVSGSPINNSTVGLNLTITDIGNGWPVSSGPLSFVGTISYVYVWTDRVLTLAEAASIDANPYGLFGVTSGGGTWPNMDPGPQRVRIRDTVNAHRSGPAPGYHTTRVVWCGTSITAGNHLNAGEKGYPELVAVDLPIDSRNIGVPGSSLVGNSTIGPTADALIDPTKELNICSLEYGANDGLSFSAATFNAAQDAFVAARLSAGFNYVVVLTMLPCGSYASTAFRAAINAHTTSTYPQVADVGNTGTTMGAETAVLNTLWYSDTVHPTALGYTLYYTTVRDVISVLMAFTEPPPPATTDAIKPEVYVEAELGGIGSGDWTDITSDVLVQYGIEIRRGMTGSGPKDIVAPPGTARFALNNSASNSAGLLGYYSPYNANCRSGWRQGINCRIRFRDSNTGEFPTRFIGQVDEINPTPGKHAARDVSVMLVDWMDLALRFIIPASVGVQVNKRWDEILSAILAQMPRQPTSTSFDGGTDAYPYALDTIAGSNQYVLSEFAKLAASEVGLIYIQGDGTLRAEARHTRLLNTTVVWNIAETELQELSLPTTRAEIINKVIVTFHPRQVDIDAATLLYDQPNVIAITAGASQILLGSFTDPVTRDEIGAVDVQDQTALDRIANTIADGTGTDISSSITASINIGPNGFSETLTNSNVVTAYLTVNRFYGRGLYDKTPQTVQESDTTSIALNDEHPVEFDMPYQGSIDVAAGVALYFKNKYSTAFAQARTIRVVSRSSTLMALMLSREISNRLAITETVTGVANEFFINGITDRITPSGHLVSDYILAPSYDPFAGLYWILDTSTLGTDTIPSPA